MLWLAVLLLIPLSYLFQEGDWYIDLSHSLTRLATKYLEAFQRECSAPS